METHANFINIMIGIFIGVFLGFIIIGLYKFLKGPDNQSHKQKIIICQICDHLIPVKIYEEHISVPPCPYCQETLRELKDLEDENLLDRAIALNNFVRKNKS